MNIFIKDVMTARVISVKRDTPFTAIASALREHRVSAFPVLNEEGQVIGVVSESDLLAKLALGGGEDERPGMMTSILRQHDMEKAHAITAEDLMSSPAYVASPEDTIEHAAQIMYRRKAKRLPVVDADNHLVGIVSRADLLAAYDRPDVEIGEEIRNDIAVCESPADALRIDVNVTDGVVTLTGRPRTSEQAYGILRRARHVHGVVAVRDRLDYPPAGAAGIDVLTSFPVD